MKKKIIILLLLILTAALFLECGDAVTTIAAKPASETRRAFPDTSDGIFVFNDQLASYMSDAQFQFATTHYVGCQKMTRQDTRKLRSYNPNFIVLHYRLGIGLGYQYEGNWIQIIEGDNWVREWPASPQDSWFFPYAGSTRVYKPGEGWYLMDISSNTWRNYWTQEVLRQLSSNENDGLFADCYIVPNYLGNDLFDPDLPAIDASFETQWSTRLHEFTDYLKTQFAGKYYLIPNIGALITSRDSTDYTNIDGGMIENFCAWREGDYFETSDWQLQMNRVLSLINLDKIILAQSYLDNSSNISSRLFFLCSYLLLKDKHTYINIDMGPDPEYFPEYNINLGRALESAGDDISNLYVSDSQVYRRRFENGMVLVNCGDVARTMEQLGIFYSITPVGGGFVPENADISSWKVNYSAVTSITLPPHSGAILLNSNSPKPTKSLSRLFGDTQYETAVEISKEGWSASNEIILSRGDLFPDALSGAPLAAKYNAPILLSHPQSLTQSTAAEIKRLGAKKIKILGSDNAIYPRVVEDLQTQCEITSGNISRLGGDTRYETASEIAKQLTPPANKTAIIAYGENYPDALASASAAAYQGMPILLVKFDEIPPATQEALKALKIEKTIIVGGADVVSSGIEKWLSDNKYAPTRLGGDTRYDTCYLISDHILNNMGMGADAIGVAFGENFPDALTLGPLAGKLKAPVILVRNTFIPEKIKEFLNIHKNDIYQVYLAGGTDVVSEGVEAEIKTILRVRP